MKKILSVILSLTMFFSITTVLSVPASVDAVSNRTKAIRAYKKFLKKERKKKESYMYDGNNTIEKFSIINLDKNKTPEMVLQKGSLYYVYTFKNGKVKKTDIDNMYTLDERFYYYPKSGIYTRCSARDGFITTAFVKLTGTKIKYKLSEQTIMGSSNYSNDYPSAKYYKITTKGSKKISKKTFKSTLKKLTRGKKGKVAKFYSNTVSNRKKHCK